MRADIITPEKTIFSAEADMVIVPGIEGDFGVLEGHAPFISTVRPGIVYVTTAGGEKRKIAVIGGVAEAVPDRCTVLADNAEDWTALSSADAQARLDQAKAAMAAAENEEDRGIAARKIAAAEAMLTFSYA